MAGEGSQIPGQITARDVEEAVERGIRRGMASMVSSQSSDNGNAATSSIAGIVGRARDLLRTNATAVGNAVTNSISRAGSNPKRRRLPHPYEKPKVTKQPEAKTMEICCLDFIDPREFEDDQGNAPLVIPNYPMKKDDLLFTGTVDLLTNDKEKDIRDKIMEVLKSRIKGIKSMDFSFIKVSRRDITTPACKEGHKWDYPQVKAIAGQGKLYVRLEKPMSEFETSQRPRGSSSLQSPSSSNASSSHTQTSTSNQQQSYKPPSSSGVGAPTRSHSRAQLSPRSSYPEASSCSHASSNSMNTYQASAGSSSKIQPPSQTSSCSQPNVNLDDEEKEEVQTLKLMFPEKDIAFLSAARADNITLQDTIDEILDLDTTDPPELKSLPELMANHRNTVIRNEHVNRVSVDRETLWEDSIVTFKHPSFDVYSGMRVKFCGEAGLDAGGLSVEYCSLLATAIFSRTAALFEGCADRCVPIYNSEAIHSNIFALAGKMVSYLITHHDIGIPCLSPAVYQYIATGDIEIAASVCSVLDVPDLDVRDIITKFDETSTAEDLKKFLLENPTVRDTLGSSGWVKDITLHNKGYATINLLVHEVIRKRKEPLEQFRSGLQSLSVLTLIQKYPELMKPYFIADKCEKALSPDILLNKVFDKSAVKEDQVPENERARCFFLQSLSALYDDEQVAGMQNVLMFVTARDSVPPLGLTDRVKIIYRTDSGSSFFAETCLMNLQVPVVHEEFEEFYQQFKMAVDYGCNGFGSI